LRALKKIVSLANQAAKEVSVCGDMAHEERYLTFLLGIGVRVLSVDPHYIPRIQQAMSKINLAEARIVAENMLSQSRISDLAQNFICQKRISPPPAD